MRALFALLLVGCAPTAAGVAIMDAAPDLFERSPLTFSVEGYQGGVWGTFAPGDMHGRYLLVHGAGYW